jgi:hypothetical protein
VQLMALGPAPITGRHDVHPTSAAVFVCVAVFLVAGCGGGGGASQPVRARTSNSFRLASSVCARYNETIYQERAGSGKRSNARGPSSFLSRRLTLLRRVEAALTPVHARAGVQDYLAKLSSEAAMLRQLQSALKTGYATYSTLALSPSFRSDLHRAQSEAAASARHIGLKTCAGPRPRAPISG